MSDLSWAGIHHLKGRRSQIQGYSNSQRRQYWGGGVHPKGLEKLIIDVIHVHFTPFLVIKRSYFFDTKMPTLFFNGLFCKVQKYSTGHS